MFSSTDFDAFLHAKPQSDAEAAQRFLQRVEKRDAELRTAEARLLGMAEEIAEGKSVTVGECANEGEVSTA